MKQLKNKLTKIIGRNSDKSQSVGRITNETVAEHREQVLAGGRRYKYPHQYVRNRLIRNSIIISLIAILLLVALGWWQLYSVQNTSKFFYRLTQLVPVPVAKIDGKYVPYSDYLMRLRSELHYLERESAINLNSADGKRQTAYQKRIALNKVEAHAYVKKLADQRNIEVSNKEINDFINQQLNNRKPAVTRTEYEKIIKDYYDWSYSEYKEFIREQLLRRKVAIAIDDTARAKAKQIVQQLASGGDFAAIAKAASDDTVTKNNGGDVGFVAKSNDDPDGLIAAAQRLKPGELSEAIETRSGYYIIKLIENKTNEIRYARILVGLKELDNQITKVREDPNKVTEYISVPKNVGPTRQ